MNQVLRELDNSRPMDCSTNLSVVAPKNHSSRFRWLTQLPVWSVMCVFLLASCSEADESPTDVNVVQNQSLSLLPSGGEPIYIDAVGGKLSGESMKSADQGRFEITLKYITPVTERQKEVFEQAAERWQRIIIKDVPSVTPVASPIPSAFFGFPPAADVGETIDDLVIEVAIAPIDGPGSILGQAGPRFIRTADNLSLTGVMFFDVDDLELLDFFDLFEEVIVHEMGHVLGIGTLWSFNRTLIDGTAADPFFTGKKANIHWQAEGGTGFLPIENTGGGGTRFSHWRESVLVNELMTGFINLGENPLSRITAGSIRDLGYGAAMVGEQYDLPKDAGENTRTASEEAPEGINIAEMETILEPVGYVNIQE